jgi:hypothetical protein
VFDERAKVVVSRNTPEGNAYVLIAPFDVLDTSEQKSKKKPS